MPIENECKYLLKKDCYLEIFSESSSKLTINQGYLSKNNRIRSVKTKNEIKYYFTFKKIVDSNLIELESQISEKDFTSLWKTTKVRIQKERFILSHKWEIDFYFNNNKIYGAMAEIELKEKEVKPKYIPKIIEKNILYYVKKHDVRFFNNNLTKTKMTKLYKELNNANSKI